MFRLSKFAPAALCVLALVSCSGTPQTMTSPSAAEGGTATLNPDGSNLKANPPTNLTPTGAAVLDTVRPTLTFTGATGKHTSATFDHEVQIVNANDVVVYSSPSISSPHGVSTDLSYADNFWWRVRARQGAEFGPWSAYAQFRTPDPPTPVAPPPGSGGGSFGFPVPAQCLAGDAPGCASAMSALSIEWERCRGGSGVGCHRFTRQVANALALADRNWANIQAAPGGQACSCTSCGPSDGTMFREDTIVYAGSQVFDLIVGAGGPSPSLSFSSVPGPRPGDLPIRPPLCP
jgi:hypothetical protein